MGKNLNELKQRKWLLVLKLSRVSFLYSNNFQRFLCNKKKSYLRGDNPQRRSRRWHSTANLPWLTLFCTIIQRGGCTETVGGFEDCPRIFVSCDVSFMWPPDLKQVAWSWLSKASPDW